MNYVKMGEAALKRFDEAYAGAKSDKAKGQLLAMLASRLPANNPTVQTVNTVPVIVTALNPERPADAPEPIIGREQAEESMQERINRAYAEGVINNNGQIGVPVNSEKVEAAPAHEVPYEPVQIGGVTEAQIKILREAQPSNANPVSEGTDHAEASQSAPPAYLWPEHSEVLIYGWASNPRLMLGELPDKRKVSVWRAPRQYRLPQKFNCKLDVKNPGNPIYVIQ